ncbi:tyrosine-type recombinase/integrase [Desulfovibrio sp.]|uniref:tyrosine-type recombinase/integrase n=1 Tax=Desulfovibrio sp. TaxID=885 RepID=UPI0025C5DBCC|nr:tyrosine-type recombinase/integrase [Desulfovibrio sp.]
MLDQADAIKTLTPQQVDDLLYYCEETRKVARNRVIVLLTVDAGLTVTEISKLVRRDVMKDGLVCREIRIQGKKARTIPMSERLFDAILDMQRALPGDQDSPVIVPEKWQDILRHRPFRPSSVAYVLYKLFVKAGLDASSFAGRRTFVKEAMTYSPMVGASTSDIQALSGLKSEQSLDRYGDRYAHSNVARVPIPFARTPANRLRQVALVDVIAKRA